MIARGSHHLCGFLLTRDNLGLKKQYRGVLCNVPAQTYTLLDIPYTEWPRFYDTRGEIRGYLSKIKKRYI